MPTATQRVDNGDYREEIELNENGIAASRVYEVDTEDAQDAMDAIGLPAIGAALGTGRYAACTARRVRTARVGGNPGDGNGFTRVTVDYATPGTNGQGETPVAGARWTNLEPATITVTAYTSAPATVGGPGAQPYETRGNCPGVPKDVGYTRVRVTRVESLDDFNANLGNAFVQNLIALHARQAVNDAAIDLPPLEGVGTVLTADTAELRFAGFTFETQGDVVVLTYSMLWNTGHEIAWEQFADDGQLGTIRTTQPYGTANFDAFW